MPELSCVPCVGSEDTYPVRDIPTYGMLPLGCCPLGSARVVHPTCSRRVFECESRSNSDQMGIEISRVCCYICVL